MSDDDSGPIPFGRKPDTLAQLRGKPRERSFVIEAIIKAGAELRERLDSVLDGTPIDQLDEGRRYDVEKTVPWRLELPNATNRCAGDAGNEHSGYGLAKAVWKFEIYLEIFKNYPELLYKELDDELSCAQKDNHQKIIEDYKEKSVNLQYSIFNKFRGLCKINKIQIHGRKNKYGNYSVISTDELDCIDFADLDQCVLTGPSLYFCDCVILETIEVDGPSKDTLENILSKKISAMASTMTFVPREQAALARRIMDDPRISAHYKPESVSRIFGKLYRAAKDKHLNQRGKSAKPEKPSKIRQ